ncbi:MAG: biotin synthase BioB [Bdellovibrionota bacterium]
MEQDKLASLLEGEVVHDLDRALIDELFAWPLSRLLRTAAGVHVKSFADDEVQLCTLLSIKTGGCKEDCSYCPQSAHHKAEVESHQLLDLDVILENAKKAKAEGATRFCMGAAWRTPPKKGKQFDEVLDAVRSVSSLGLEVCTTLGMLDAEQAIQLKEAGVYAYNHNLDTSPEYYPEVITTRTYEDRLETLRNVRAAGMTVCCGGIVGMGESRKDRVGLLHQLHVLEPHPESVPINLLVKVDGTPFESLEDLDIFELIRTIAVARIIMPKSRVRLSAGREHMSDEAQALCFLAGANSVFSGEKLLTTANPELNEDLRLFARLGIKPMASDLPFEHTSPISEVESSSMIAAQLRNANATDQPSL